MHFCVTTHLPVTLTLSLETEKLFTQNLHRAADRALWMTVQTDTVLVSEFNEGVFNKQRHLPPCKQLCSGDRKWWVPDLPNSLRRLCVVYFSVAMIYPATPTKAS